MSAPKKLEDLLRETIRFRQMSYRTEETYVQWHKRFVIFHGKRHPLEMGAAEVEAFLTHLAAEGRVSRSTQNQALNAVIFLYRQVLEKPLEQINALRAPERKGRMVSPQSLASLRASAVKVSGLA